MNNKEYDKLIKSVIKSENIYKNILISFISGGMLGLFGELLSNYLLALYSISISDSYLIVFILYILIGSILTGFGIFDKILSICKFGFVVPSTGFANAMTSPAMDTRSEGFVKGIGGNIFKLTGSIILYGIVFGIIFGFIRGVIL